MDAAELQGLIEDEQRDNEVVQGPWCSSGRERCLAPEEPLDVHCDGQYDRYGIYAGVWHEECWQRFGYADFEFDPSYAGESLDEEGFDFGGADGLGDDGW